jgi:hypothetical protein
MDRTEQQYVMKFLSMDRRKYRAIHTELSRVPKGHTVSVVFANIGVENSKLAVFRWMTG